MLYIRRFLLPHIPTTNGYNDQPGYTVKQCRGHWHIYYDDTDIYVDGDPFMTLEAAEAAMQGVLEQYWDSRREYTLSVLLKEYADGYGPIRADTTHLRPTDGAMAHHIAWMCQQIPELQHPTKKHRWVGFVQGVLWVLGRRSIDQLRKESQEI